MKKRVFIAGHLGLVGSAVSQTLRAKNSNFEIITRSRKELDLEDAVATTHFFKEACPDYVVLSAAKVGGILANSTMPVDFLHVNLKIQLNVFEAAFAAKVQRVIFLGSSCIYPRDCRQPIKEDYLLTGPLEKTNRPYAVAKIAGIESCWSYNRQYNTQYLALMPTNMYGPNDNYHPEYSHVLPALIRRFHEARVNNEKSVLVWGSGEPKREFMYSLDIGNAIKFFLELPESIFSELTRPTQAPLINVGVGSDISIYNLAMMIKEVVGYKGDIKFDASKPDGTPQKLLDISRLNRLGWKASTTLAQGLKCTYQDFITKKLNK